jgi:glutamyl-tRNA synthetase
MGIQVLIHQTMSGIVTRFAPSPTGILHLGSARTALFNWLYARHYGGQFLLRLEDTDQARSSQASADNILSNLKWLGLDWDGDVVIQSQRQQRHQDIAHQLLDMGKAYRCYCTPEELAAMKEDALARGVHPAYDRRWRDRTDHPQGPFVIRLKAPLSGEVSFHDTVQGLVKVDAEHLDDMILLRSDGTPTYMLAVVVDDHDMGVTHIIRGDDHLTNGFRQLNVYHAMGWTAPSMSHIPLIHSDDGAKLSKRHGAIGIEQYRADGFLPEAICNGLLRLGWSHGNDEKIDQEQAIAWFDGTSLSKSAARFDQDKFLSLNGHYLRQRTLCDDGLESLWHDVLHEPLDAPVVPDGLSDAACSVGKSILPALAVRATSLCSLRTQLIPYLTPCLEKPPVLSGNDGKVISELISVLRDLSPWTSADIEEYLRQWSQEKHLSFGAVAKPLRLVLTGQPISPSLTDIMVALGKETSLLRMQNSVNASPCS